MPSPRPGPAARGPGRPQHSQTILPTTRATSAALGKLVLLALVVHLVCAGVKSVRERGVVSTGARAGQPGAAEDGQCQARGEQRRGGAMGRLGRRSAYSCRLPGTRSPSSSQTSAARAVPCPRLGISPCACSCSPCSAGSQRQTAQEGLTVRVQPPVGEKGRQTQRQKARACSR